MRYLVVILICEIAAVACVYSNIPAPLPVGTESRFTAFAFAGHLAADCACLCVSVRDLVASFRG